MINLDDLKIFMDLYVCYEIAREDENFFTCLRLR